MSLPRMPGSFSSSACEPARSHAIESQTRTVIAGGSRLAVLDHVEVVIEGRDLVDLGHRHLQFRSQRDEMHVGEAPEAVLDQVEVFDQQIGAARPVAEQFENFGAGFRINGAPLGSASDPGPLPFFGRLVTDADGACGVRSLIEK